jgi:ABC-2 type transport system permease protein
MTSAPTRTGVLTVAGREIRRWGRSPLAMLLLVALPIASVWLTLAIFGNGAARDLPVAVADQDGSALSRSLVRMIDATGGLRVVQVGFDSNSARAEVVRGRAYGLIVIPRHFARDVARGEAPTITAFYNAQYLLPASLIRSAVAASTGTLSAQVEVRQRVAAGEPLQAAVARADPIQVDVHTLFNPELNYVTYLVTALLPTLLQIFIITTVVHAYAGELRDGTAGEWLAAAGGRTWKAVAGKALPYAAHFTVLGLFMLAIIHGNLGVPFRGSLPVMAWATAAFVLAYVAMGFAFASLTGNLRLGTSLAAFYSAPAFAFAGVTFPVEGMPVAGQAWGSLLPVTYYLRIIVQQGLRAAPIDASWQPFLLLLAFAAVPWPFLAWRMGRLIRDPRAWGRS